MSARSTDRAVVTLAGVAVFLILAIIALAACNPGGGGDTYYYPQDHSHGYYDVHHHYHYYPKYDRHSKVYVAPRKGASGVKIKPGTRSGGGLFKSGGSKGFSGGSKRR